jgi:uncharacterized protein (DUF736 family)
MLNDRNPRWVGSTFFPWAFHPTGQTARGNDNAPSHRVYVGRAEIGAAWSKRSEEGRGYLSLKLDDPSFNAPIYANLFDDEDGEGYTLIWSRPRKSAD